MNGGVATRQELDAEEKKRERVIKLYRIYILLAAVYETASSSSKLERQIKRQKMKDVAIKKKKERVH